MTAEDASEKAAQVAGELYQRGLTDFLSVLDAQRDQLANQDALTQSDTATATDLVALYQSFGGGWKAKLAWVLTDIPPFPMVAC